MDHYLHPLPYHLRTILTQLITITIAVIIRGSSSEMDCWPGVERLKLLAAHMLDGGRITCLQDVLEGVKPCRKALTLCEMPWRAWSAREVCLRVSAARVMCKVLILREMS